MVTGDQTPDDVEEVTNVDEPAAEPKKVAAKKAPRKPKKPVAKSKRRKPTAKPVEPKPAPPVYTLDELKAQGREAKSELVSAVIEPALEAVGSLSQTVRDTIGGALSGLLSRKRRG